jgi:ABC-type polysaccharide/polyol phosphate export permease
VSVIVEPFPEQKEEPLKVYDIALVPADPPDEHMYQHKPDLWHAIKELFTRVEVIFTLAERDIRAAYKQAVLGVAWALLTPLISLVVLVLIFQHVKSINAGGHIPYILYTYVGLVTWGVFGGAVGSGANSLVSNKLLMAKSHFPREYFPLTQVVESIFGSVLSLVPLFVMFGIKGFAPKVTSLWAPLYIAIELLFTIGLVLLLSAIIVQMRDLQQVLPILVPLGMLATVIKPFTTEAHHALHPAFITGWGRSLYCVLNPMAPIVDSMRISVLYGFGPQWKMVLLAMAGSFGYLVIGYLTFKKLEVNFADLT